MGRLLTLLLGAAVVAGAAYWALRGASPRSSGEATTVPAQRLERVRNEAKRIEEDAARRAAETMEKATSE